MAEKKPNLKELVSQDKEQDPLSALGGFLNLEGATLYVVDQKGIAEGVYAGRDGRTIYYTDELTGREDDAHVKNVHLFYRDARNHFKALAHDTHWGMYGPSSE
ncbi:MAG: hypothetical protein GVY15_06890 [Bacteroidetes bacterium]|jgi:hypothetical protein|nr:hypothetical protein [Bacteroidota bacterium]